MNEWNGGGGGGGCGDGERSRVPYLIVVYCIDLIEMVSLFYYFLLMKSLEISNFLVKHL